MEPGEAEWAWFAGLFEGQGSLVLHLSSPRRCRFQVKTTDLELARLIRDRIGGRLFGPYAYQSSDGVARKSFWIWVGDGLDPDRISSAITPWLGARRRAKLAEFGLLPPGTPPRAFSTGAASGSSET